MKLLLVFVLCGVTYCLAGPTCSRDELAKCSEGPRGRLGTEVEELDRLCREFKCWIEIYERCGTAVFAEGYFSIKGFRRFVNGFCDRSNPLRGKYLENVKCIRRATESDNMKKIVNMCGIVDIPKEEYCREIPDRYKCAVDYIAGKCGKDAGEVAYLVALPFYDPYDCMSS